MITLALFNAVKQNVQSKLIYMYLMAIAIETMERFCFIIV